MTLFFCSIMVKSSLRSGDRVLERSAWSMRSTKRSLGLLVVSERVRDPVAGLTSTRLMPLGVFPSLCLCPVGTSYRVRLWVAEERRKQSIKTQHIVDRDPRKKVVVKVITHDITYQILDKELIPTIQYDRVKRDQLQEII